jgi:hypothetical protein
MTQIFRSSLQRCILVLKSRPRSILTPQTSTSPSTASSHNSKYTPEYSSNPDSPHKARYRNCSCISLIPSLLQRYSTYFQIILARTSLICAMASVWPTQFLGPDWKGLTTPRSSLAYSGSPSQRSGTNDEASRKLEVLWPAA